MRSACATGSSSSRWSLCILGLALYPQLILKRTDASVPGSRSKLATQVGAERVARPADGSGRRQP